MKKLLSCLLIVISLVSFASCAEPAPQYRDDIQVNALYKNGENKVKLETEGAVFVQKSELTLQAEPSIPDAIQKCSDSYFGFTGGNSFDEYGILHVKNPEDVESVKALAKEYLDAKKNDELYRSYFPEEDYKLDEAEVKVFGNYVVYATLSKTNRTAFFAEIEQLLKTV